MREGAGSNVTPTVLDAEGRVLEVGSRVMVGGLDESLVRGFVRGYAGSLRVAHTWLTGFHPDEPEPSELAIPDPEQPNTYRCPDLLITDKEKGDGDG